MSIAAQFTIETSVVSRTTEKYIFMTYYSVIKKKKNEIISFAGTWRELEMITLSDHHHRHPKAKSCMFLLICGTYT
jgi:hypothetical protein